MSKSAILLLSAVVLLLPPILHAAVELQEDPPVCKPPKSGMLRGRIESHLPISDLSAICRATGKTYAPKIFDAETGRFAFEELPGAACYDLRFNVDNRRIEGVCLEFVDRELIELAKKRRERMGLEMEQEGRFTSEDVKQLQAYVAQMKDFMEQRRILYMNGEGKHATLLVELMRTRDFHDGKGQYVWRVELWYFEKFYGGWDKLANQERVLERFRGTPERWSDIQVEYYPMLSGKIARDGGSEPMRFRVPKEADLSRGRVSGTPPEVKTAPHVFGAKEGP